MRDRPHPNHRLEWPGGVVPEWARPQQKRRGKGRGGKGGGGGKRERLQKVMAQSGYGSRRNIEILIAQGHITINGQVAKLGDSVGPGDKVKMDGNIINLRFGEALPRVMLYHKPTGEIVTRDDPEKRPTVFEKLPKVNGGRCGSVDGVDFNTEALLGCTTNGDLRRAVQVRRDVRGRGRRIESLVPRDPARRQEPRGAPHDGSARPHGEPPHPRALRLHRAARPHQARDDARDGRGGSATAARV